jgi:hypothetical protein
MLSTYPHPHALLEIHPMVQNLVRLNLKYVRVGLSENGVDHIQFYIHLFNIYISQKKDLSTYWSDLRQMVVCHLRVLVKCFSGEWD